MSLEQQREQLPDDMLADGRAGPALLQPHVPLDAEQRELLQMILQLQVQIVLSLTSITSLVRSCLCVLRGCHAVVAHTLKG